MFKKLFSLVIVICLSLALSSVALAEEPIRYLALGDSITTGYGLEDESQSFAQILAANNGYTLSNKAVNGNTIVGLLTQMADPALMAEIAGADVITLSCGGNDLMSLLYSQAAAAYNATLPQGVPPMEPTDVLTVMTDPASAQFQALLVATLTVLSGNEAIGLPPFAETEIFQTSLTGYIAALNQVTKAIYAVNPDVTLIVTTQYNPYQTFTALYAKLNAGIGAGAEKLSQAIIDNAAAAGYLVADVYAAFLSSEISLCNASMATPMNLDFHPNADGHALIADTIQAVLDSLS